MQIFLIFFVKRINIKWFLSATLGISALLMGAVPFTDGITQHYIIYSVCGILQAGIWGGLIKVLSNHLPTHILPIANQAMSAGPAIAGVAAYAVAAVFGENWKLPFFLMSAVVLFAVVLYFISVSRMEKFPKEIETHHVINSDGSEADVLCDDENDFIHLDTKRRVVIFYIASMVCGLLFTCLYFAVSNSLDIYLVEVGRLSNGNSKLLTILAPVFAVVGPFVCVRLCERYKNFICVSVAFFALAMLASLLLLFFFDKSTTLSLALIVSYIVLVNGGRSVTLSIASLRMRSKIDTGVYSTTVNAVSSISSGFAPKIITRVLDNTSYSVNESWQISFIIIFLLSLATVVFLTLLIVTVKFANRKRV
jgi:sugar phosphate permease